MLQSHQIEELLLLVSSLDRRQLTRQFQNFRGSFPIDFTPQFLDSLSLERLQHIFLALCLQQQHVPSRAELTEAAVA